MNFIKLQVSKSTTLELETKVTVNMKISKRGRTFESGKNLSTDLRRSIIDEIILNGGNAITGYFSGYYETVASRFRVARSTV